MLLAAAASARAAHPFLTDDTGTQGSGRWQLELLGEEIRSSATADTGAGPVQRELRNAAYGVVLTRGIRDDLDVALGGIYLRQRSVENGTTVYEAAGRGDSVLELKWRFYDAGGLSLALKPGLVLPSGDEARGLGTGRTYWGANLIVTQGAGDWTLLANLAYLRSRYALPADAEANRANLWRASAGFAYRAAAALRLVGEGGRRSNPAHEDPFAPGAVGGFVMLGVIYSPSADFDLDLGLRRRMSRAEPDDALLAGATLRW